jgi:hypothetical protein
LDFVSPINIQNAKFALSITKKAFDSIFVNKISSLSLILSSQCPSKINMNIK